MQKIDDKLAKKIHDKAEEKGVELPKSSGCFTISKYTTDELLEMLPAEIQGATLILYKEERSNYSAWYEKYNNLEFGLVKETPTPSQALGELYLYCLENDLIK